MACHKNLQSSLSCGHMSGHFGVPLGFSGKKWSLTEGGAGHGLLTAVWRRAPLIIGIMPNDNSLPHVYQRTVSADDRHDSLSVIANLIKPGQTLLDLGMGVGGLGQYLSQQFEVLADGVTLNQAEADMASQWYRQTCVADLDSANRSELFDG